jgi:taurine dioxygenase
MQKRLTTHFGVEVIFDANTGAGGARTILNLLAEHGLVVMRRSGLNAENFPELVRKLGRVVRPPFLEEQLGEGISVLEHTVQHTSFQRRRQTVFASGWHADWSFLPQRPELSILLCEVAPEVGGGTVFCDTRPALAQFSDPMRSILDKCSAEHSSAASYSESGVYARKQVVGVVRRAGVETRTARHGVVVRSPVDGGPCLNVNPAYVTSLEGFDEDESQALLELMYRKILQQEFMLHVSWEEEMLVVWDNHRFLHRALDQGIDGRRRLLRANVLLDGS